MTVTITHPGAGLLAPALDTLTDVVAGDWASVARLCAARLKDAKTCGFDLDVVAVRAGVVRSPRHAYDYQVHHRFLVVSEHPAVLCAALDLYVQLWLGRWDTLEQVAPVRTRPIPGWRPLELLRARARHQLPGTWPEESADAAGLTQAPPTARLAHHILTALEGGSASPLYDVPAGPAAVHVT